jgi:UTP-glucose-1-phosphate uridylyltransferase/mevalonate kinase
MKEGISINKDKIELFVPGRLCLFGEHSDWAGQMRKFNSDIVPGQALVACTEEGIYATARINDTLQFRTVTPDGMAVSFEHPFAADELRRIAAEGGFFSYVAGVAAYIATYYDIGGIALDCHKMTLPPKKGLSSSAAICVLTARAFNRLYGLNLTVRGEMEAAYYGEQLTPSRCGRLDQACAYGKGIAHLTFDGDNLDVQPVRVGAPLHFVFADLKGKKDTVAILRNLNAAYPYPQTDAHHNLHHLLGKGNARIIGDSLTAMQQGDAAAIGALMQEAQKAFDAHALPLSPVELEAKLLHGVLNDPQTVQWIYGGKGVGSQGDGSIQFIAKDKPGQQALKDYLANDLGLDSYCLTVPKTKAVRKAVIPVAGYGTRMYPATKIMKKEFFPVIDTDGYAKPVLLVILDELLNAGIEEICLIIRPGEEDIYLTLFRKLQEDQESKLPGNLKSYERKLSALREKITFAYQDKMLGFGHAVMQSERFANGEPVLLLLGDHLYRSGGSVNCAAQLISAFEKTERLTIGLFEILPQDAPKYGMVKGTADADDPRRIALDTIVEKPSVDYAQANLGIGGKQSAVFMYVLTPEVYQALEQQYQDGKTEFGEFQLTPALDAVIKKEGACGYLIDGERFDVGLPAEYRSTVAKYGR